MKKCGEREADHVHVACIPKRTDLGELCAQSISRRCTHLEVSHPCSAEGDDR